MVPPPIGRALLYNITETGSLEYKHYLAVNEYIGGGYDVNCYGEKIVLGGTDGSLVYVGPDNKGFYSLWSENNEFSSL